MPPKSAAKPTNTVSFTTADGRKVSFERDPNKPKKPKPSAPPSSPNPSDSQGNPNPRGDSASGPQTRRPTDLQPILVLDVGLNLGVPDGQGNAGQEHRRPRP